MHWCFAFVVILRFSEENTILLQIVDNVKRMSKNDWRRVIAVFTNGKEWEFKPWAKGFKAPADVFAKTCGFHLYFDDSGTKGKVDTWNVHRLAVSKSAAKRHLDAAVQKAFWQHLDAFVKAKKPMFVPGAWDPLETIG